MTEEWRDIPSYEGLYQVSSQGNVRSLDKRIPRGEKSFIWKGRLLNPTINKVTGYSSVMLARNANDHVRHHVHDLVARSFHGVRPSGHVINHKDGNKVNNNPSNLEYVTQQKNIDHAWDSGLTNQRGERSSSAKFTTQQVLAMHTAFRNGATRAELAVQYGVGREYIALIIAGRRWKHLHPDYEQHQVCS